MNNSDHPIAYFITFTCRGAWLHGDARGSVDLAHNEPGTPFLPPDPERLADESNVVESYIMDEGRRKEALKAIEELAKRKSWNLLAAHVRSNHIHIVVSANGSVERIMNDVKTAISRRLNKLYPAEAGAIRWTRHGSTRYLWKNEDVESAVEYTISGQGNAMAVFDGRDNPSRARSAAE